MRIFWLALLAHHLYPYFKTALIWSVDYHENS